MVCGGSVIGLSLAAMLGKDGHQVTVLESVDCPPQAAAQAWDRWERTGVPQFRQPHNLFARFRQVCDEELPGLSERLLAAGCVWVDYLDPLPPDLPDRSPRPDDDRLRFITGRRPVVESVIADLATGEPGVTVRRGTRVAGLLPGATVLMREGIEQEPREPAPKLFTAATCDADVFRGFLETVLCLALPQEVAARPDIRAKLDRVDTPPPRGFPGPDRTELLRLLAA